MMFALLLRCMLSFAMLLRRLVLPNGSYYCSLCYLVGICQREIAHEWSRVRLLNYCVTVIQDILLYHFPIGGKILVHNISLLVFKFCFLCLSLCFDCWLRQPSSFELWEWNSLEELLYRVINKFMICIPVYLSSSIGYIAVYQWWLSLASSASVSQ